jgi:hypothetical protein
MLGHGPVGTWALGQLPSADAVALGATLSLDLTLVPGVASGGVAGDAIASGALLDLTLSLTAGVATGVGQVTIMGGRRRLVEPDRDAVVRGAHFNITLSLLPGRVIGDRRQITVVAGGDMLPIVDLKIVGGAAEGDASNYDNDFILLLAA